jgi:hypothetical protein
MPPVMTRGMQEKMEANHDHSATGTVQTIHQNFAEVNSIEPDSNLPQLPTLADSTCAESVEKHVDAVSPEKIEKNLNVAKLDQPADIIVPVEKTDNGELPTVNNNNAREKNIEFDKQKDDNNVIEDELKINAANDSEEKHVLNGKYI